MKCILFIVFISSLFVMNVNSGEINKKNMNVYLKSVDYGISLVNDQPQKNFLNTQYSDIPSSIRSQSENCLRKFLKPEALPQKSTELITRYFLADKKTEYDLIEYKWEFLGYELRLVESINAVKLEINLKNIENLKQLDLIKPLVSQIVKLKGVDRYNQDYKIKIQWPDLLKDDISFSSNPNSSIIRILHWYNRVDVFVKNNILSLLFYKKVPQLVGYQDGFGWIKREDNKE